MATILSVADIVEIGRVSTYLSANYTSKQALFGGSVIKPVPPVQIAFITDALDWGINGGAQTDTSLRSTSNYAYWVYGRFQLQSQNTISGPGGGSVAPTPSGGATPNDLDFIVSASTIIPTGGTSVVLPQYAGYDIDFARNGTVQYTTPQPGGALYYSWNSVTTVFTLLGTSPEAQDGESFRIMVDAGGSGTAAAATDVFPFVVTSADFEVDGVTLNDSRIVGNTVYLQVNNTPNPFLFAPDDFVYVVGGIEVVTPGFDATSFSYTIVVNKLN